MIWVGEGYTHRIDRMQCVFIHDYLHFCTGGTEYTPYDIRNMPRLCRHCTNGAGTPFSSLLDDLTPPPGLSVSLLTLRVAVKCSHRRVRLARNGPRCGDQTRSMSRPPMKRVIGQGV
jgi:hypothetical protein